MRILRGSIEIEFGKRYRDKITGYEGVATAKTQYMNGCCQTCLESPAKPGEEPKSFWFDDQRLVEAETEKPVKTPARVGGAVRKGVVGR